MTWEEATDHALSEAERRCVCGHFFVEHRSFLGNSNPSFDSDADCNKCGCSMWQDVIEIALIDDNDLYRPFVRGVPVDDLHP